MKYHRTIPVCSLIISTYNTPDRLRRCLQSVLRQRVMPSEIIIADDGSGPDTKKVIDEITAVSPVPIIHVWQSDEGFRLASIRNKAIATAAGEYIINIDGDVIVNKYFIHDHLYFAQTGRFIAGMRTLLTEKSTKKYMNETNGNPSFYSASIKKRFHAFRNVLLANLYCFIRRSKTPYLYVTGCNMSFWKLDLLKINGYNEAFFGWGEEDFDIAARLVNAGIKQRFLQFYAILFHLYHPENDRSRLVDNNVLFQQAIKNKTTRIEQGIDQYLK